MNGWLARNAAALAALVAVAGGAWKMNDALSQVSNRLTELTGRVDLMREVVIIQGNRRDDALSDHEARLRRIEGGRSGYAP